MEFGAGLPSNVKVFSQSGWEIRILDLQQVGVGTILVAKKQQWEGLMKIIGWTINLHQLDSHNYLQLKSSTKPSYEQGQNELV